MSGTQHGGHVTPDMLDARLTSLELRLLKWMIGTAIAVASVAVAALRLLG